MAKPGIHAISSAKKFGGDATDYIQIHNLMDQSKSVLPSPLHRAIFHTSFGCFIIEKMFGIDFSKLKALAEKHGWSEEEVEDILQWKMHCTDQGTSMKNASGRLVQVRDVAERHILEDFKTFIPTLQDFFANTKVEPWMNNGRGLPLS